MIKRIGVALLVLVLMGIFVFLFPHEKVLTKELEGTITQISDGIIFLEEEELSFDISKWKDKELNVGDVVKIKYVENKNNLVKEVTVTKKFVLDEVLKQLDSMSVEEKVGQMFMVRIPIGSKNFTEDIKNYHLGSVVLFKPDIEGNTKESLRNKLKNYQSVSKIPLLFAVDEEGGIVNRVSSFSAFRSEPFKSPQELYHQGGMDAILNEAKEKANLLLSLGIQLNLAPVADVSTNESDYIYRRTFGKSAKDTADYIKQVVKVSKENGLSSCLKHFPGYGNNKDTHNGAALDKRDYSQFVNEDFLPFKAGIESGVEAVMVSHNTVVSMDNDYPASLSKKVHDILRNDLGFNGVIITDDVYMGAVKDNFGEEEAAILAVEAGNDMIISTSYKTQITAVVDAVKSGRIDVEKINSSVYKILSWKKNMVS